MAATKPDYKAFNKFQNYFFTNIQGFNLFTNYEIKTHAFLLFNSLTKAFPDTAKKYMFYNDFFKFDTSPELIKALQHKFINGFSRNRIPQAVYFPAAKKPAGKLIKKKRSKVDKSKIDFSPEVIGLICSNLFIDGKTYDNLKYTKKIQDLGNQIVNELEGKIKNLIKKEK